ncbi:MAG: plasmid stabilization protein [Gammaproteobacteria bacterium]|nr:plasmid stabilization protein [Gammaproteobacteria bacterium]
MGSITIRNLDDEVKKRLRVRAAEHNRSMEEEARWILREAVDKEASKPKNLVEIARECFGHLGGVELELPPREPMYEPIKFD